MALAQVNGLLSEYMSAKIDSYFLNTTGILSANKGIVDAYGTYTVREWAKDNSTWSTPSAGSDITPAAGTTFNAVSPLVRRVHSRYFPQGELIAVGLGSPNALQNEGGILADNFSLNIQNHMLSGTLSAAFTTVGVGGALTANHMYDMSSSAFKWSYVMRQTNYHGKPGQFRYALVHSDIAGSSEIYGNVDASPILNTSAPLRVFPDGNYIGQINGIHVFSTDNPALKVSTVYSSYIFSDNSVYLDYSEMPQAEIWEDKKDSGGAWISKYRTAFGMGIYGLTFVGTAPSVLGGATLATVAAGSSWSKISNVANADIGVQCIKTLIG